MQYTEENNFPGILLMIDFEKVFDSVSWNFIDKTLDIFNFEGSFRKWHWMKNQVSELRNLDGILLKLKVYVKFTQGFRCVNIKFPQSVNLSPLSFGMVSASGIIE